jgi:integrase
MQSIHHNEDSEENSDYDSAYFRFMYALKAPETKRQYPKRLEVFLDYQKLQGDSIEEKANKFYEFALDNPKAFQNRLLNYIEFQKKRATTGEISESTVPNYYKPIKLFCDMNDIIINWKIVTRGIPKGRHASEDRIPTIDEVKKLLQYPDVRIQPIVLTMISSGIRVGAWDYLRWKHIIPIKNENDDNSIIVAKIIVYAGEFDQYYSFITKEAYDSLKTWMDYRESYGEKITGESWLMRNLWKTTNMKYGSRNGLAQHPMRLKSSGVKSLVGKALFQQNVRPILEKGKKRHDFKGLHGFRKYFKTHCEQKMRPANVELLLNHDLGVSQSYYKPQEKDILEDYLKAVDLLTINSDNTTLKKQLQKVEEENKNSEYIIKGKLHEKDEEIKDLKEQFNKMDIMISTLVKNLGKSKDQDEVNIMANSLYSSGILKKD